MTDHEAMEAINAALEDYYRGRISQTEALNQIARITGESAIEHQESK
ncbi:hypothetical protein ACFFGR_09485 [Arthrobacter liuii]|uniref:Antitoxin VbhA domain-containing protein n=1 Tax=Arthrobacter liuii TaxID=1476996 RepID=A0ABQ2AQ88_9MICC|nr:hypothetical protein [Arthrobacter liuii]GGH93937.1 hypothetical protein GCM10007170_15970 [Arthrobacter liuii]